MRVLLVPAHKVAALWPLLEEYVARGIREDPYMTPRDVLDQLMLGAGTLFVVLADSGHVAGCAVMELVDYPRRRVANVLLVAGERGFLRTGWPTLFERLVAWSGSQGANAFAAVGRPGWFKFAQRVPGGKVTRCSAYSLELRPHGQEEVHPDDDLAAEREHAVQPRVESVGSD